MDIKRIRKAVPEENNLIMVQAVQQKFDVDPSALLERIYPVY